MTPKHYIFSSLFILIFSLSHAQDTLTLDQALQKGLENNYQILISQKSVEIAENNNSLGTAGLLPVITAGIVNSNTFSEFDPSALSRSGITIPDSIELQESETIVINPFVELNWTLFNGFSAQITRQKLADLQSLSEGNTAIVVENTIQGIILAYYYALLQKESMDVLKEVLDLSSDRYKYMQARKKLGAAVTFDILQAENNYLSDSANYLQQKISYENAQRNLNLLLAEPVKNTYFLTSEFDVAEEDYDLNELLTGMEKSNKTLQNQYINQEILKKDLKLSQSRMYPTLSLRSGYNKSYTNYFADWDYALHNDSYNYYGNFTLSFTLFNGGNIRRAIQNARIEEEIGQIQIDEMKQTLTNQMFSTLEQYNIRKQLKNVAELNVRSAKLNLQIAEEKFRSGAINSFNYRDIQLAYLNASNNLLFAIYNLIDSNTEILKLTGSIVSEPDEEK
jgi:outer membrane protein